MADSVNITTRSGSNAVVNSTVKQNGAVSSSVSGGSSTQASVTNTQTFNTEVSGLAGPQGPAGADGVFSEIASQAEAEAGSDNAKGMTPLRVKQAIDTLGSAVDSVNGATGVVVLDQDNVGDGTTYKQYSQTEKTKLAGIATGATANATDAALRARASHTGTQLLATISDVTASADEVNILDGATLTTAELNHVDGVTSGLQAQLDGKEPTKGADDNFVTDAEKVVIGNTSGTNTGDQDLSTYVTGPASSVDNSIPRYHSTTGKVIQTTGYTIDDDDTLLTDGLINSTTIIAAPALAASAIDEYVLDEGVDIETVHLEDGLVDGRDVSVDGTKLDGIEALADVTDAANVAAAGAVMDSGDETIAGVKTFSSDPIIPDEAYGAGWNASLEPPTKNAVYDKIEALSVGGGTGDVVGPASGTDHAVARYDGATGRLLQDSSVIISDANDLTGINGLEALDISTDSVTESTPAAGVTIDGVLIKDGQIAATYLQAVYPVGCIYFSTNSTNPATSLGFGTWSAFGAGRVPVGFDSGQTEFDTDEETGGAKTQASNVTVATQPTFTVNSHTHPLSNDGQAKITVTAAGNVLTDVAAAASWTSDRRTGGTANASMASFTEGAGLTGATDATAGTATTRTADTALTNNAVNNLQPYITVRMWKRTA